jgi:hypothetical protein
VTTVASLDQSARHGDLLEVPLDPEHAPVLLNRNSCQSLLLALLFRLTIKFKVSLQTQNLAQRQLEQDLSLCLDCPGLTPDSVNGQVSSHC